MLDLVYGVEIPQQLQELAAGHQRHLAELVERLRTVGMGDDAIEAAVDQLMSALQATSWLWPATGNRGVASFRR